MLLMKGSALTEGHFLLAIEEKLDFSDNQLGGERFKRITMFYF